jgi:general secretion pathway protein E
MDIAEKRLPQDGRATVCVGDRVIDLRLATMPTSHGERVVVRLLDKSARLYQLAEIGMEPTIRERFHRLIQIEHGLILVTGPTGSGKSTTLYAALQELDTSTRNAVTLEDPIEYQLDGISQTQINTKKGMTFASGLRSVLRQDPDIIMLGEIRDRETAVMAIQSALTGHMVFSTLHTNDAASAVTRLLDLGIEPYLVSSSLLAVLAQRLVRRICPDCSGGVSCPSCRGTGYRGREGIYELLVVTDPIRELIQARAHASTIRDAAVAEGMKLLREDGIRKVEAGITRPEEIERVTLRAGM